MSRAEIKLRKYDGLFSSVTARPSPRCLRWRFVQGTVLILIVSFGRCSWPGVFLRCCLLESPGERAAGKKQPLSCPGSTSGQLHWNLKCLKNSSHVALSAAEGDDHSPGSRAQPGVTCSARPPAAASHEARPSPTRRWLAGGQDEQQAGAQGPGWAAPGASSGESPPARPIHRLFVAPLHGAIRRPAGAACLAPDPAFSGLGQTQAPLLQAGTGGASGRVRARAASLPGRLGARRGVQPSGPQPAPPLTPLGLAGPRPPELRSCGAMAGAPGQAAGPGGRAEHGAVRAALPPCVCAGEAPRLHAEPPDACGGSVRLVPVLPRGGRAAHRTAENMAVLGDLRRQAGSCWDTLAGTTAACPPRPACGDRAGRREGALPTSLCLMVVQLRACCTERRRPKSRGVGWGPLVPGQPCPGPRWPPPWRKGVRGARGRSQGRGRAGLKSRIRPGPLVPFLLQPWLRPWGSRAPHWD